MAAKLEAVVGSRLSFRTSQKLLPLQQEAYRDFLINLSHAMRDADPHKCLEFLKHAKTLAIEMLSKYFESSLTSLFLFLFYIV